MCPAIPERRQGTHICRTKEASGPPFPRAIQGGMLGTASAGVAQGARRSVWDPETSAPGRSGERLGDWDGPMAV